MESNDGSRLEFYRVIEYLNDSKASQENFASITRRNTKLAKGYIPGFEIENLPSDENYFRQYFMSMVVSPRKRSSKEGDFLKLQEIEEVDYDTSPPDIPDENYINGTVEEKDEAPIKEIHSISDWKVLSQASNNNMSKPMDYLPNICEEEKKFSYKDSFGPHIDEDGEVKQKEYDSLVYSTPAYESNNPRTKQVAQKTRNNLAVETLNIDEFSDKVPLNTLKSPLVGLTSDISYSDRTSDIFLQSEFPIELRKQQTENIWEEKNTNYSPIRKLKRDKSSKKSLLKHSMSSFSLRKDHLKVPSEESKTVFYVNDLSEATSRSPSPKKKKKNRHQKSMVSLSNKSISTSAFDSLAPKYKKIKNLIYDSKPVGGKTHRKKKSRKLNRNVSGLLKRGFGGGQITILSTQRKPSHG